MFLNLSSKQALYMHKWACSYVFRRGKMERKNVFYGDIVMSYGPLLLCGSSREKKGLIQYIYMIALWKHNLRMVPYCLRRQGHPTCPSAWNPQRVTCEVRFKSSEFRTSLCGMLAFSHSYLSSPKEIFLRPFFFWASEVDRPLSCLTSELIFSMDYVRVV
jgi:hypothetical protein